MSHCIGKLRGCGEFRRGRRIGCRLFVGTRRLQGRGRIRSRRGIGRRIFVGTHRLQGRGQIHSRRGIGCNWPRGVNAWGLKWVRAGNSTLSQVLRPLHKRLQGKKRFGIRSRARIRGRLLVPLDRRHQDRLVGLQLGRLVGLSSIG